MVKPAFLERGQAALMAKQSEGPTKGVEAAQLYYIAFCVDKCARQG